MRVPVLLPRCLPAGPASPLRVRALTRPHKVPRASQRARAHLPACELGRRAPATEHAPEVARERRRLAPARLVQGVRQPMGKKSTKEKAAAKQKGARKGKNTKNASKESRQSGGCEGPASARYKTLEAQLDACGLRLKEMDADGNCMFRAVSDQLDGDDDDRAHLGRRKKVVDYMEAHEEQFAPFLEDDQDWKTYCSNMREDGTWGGHLELQALSLLEECNIVIHQLNECRWVIRNFDNAKTIQVSYHDGDHYNSVVGTNCRRVPAQAPGPLNVGPLPGIEEHVQAIVRELPVQEATAREAYLECGGDLHVTIDYLRAVGIEEEAVDVGGAGRKPTRTASEPNGEVERADGGPQSTGTNGLESSGAAGTAGTKSSRLVEARARRQERKEEKRLKKALIRYARQWRPGRVL
eukprot:scaffold175_cov414-Prasinococcus_capsulatus_cf.AAC.29